MLIRFIGIQFEEDEHAWHGHNALLCCISISCNSYVQSDKCVGVLSHADFPTDRHRASHRTDPAMYFEVAAKFGGRAFRFVDGAGERETLACLDWFAI